MARLNSCFPAKHSSLARGNDTLTPFPHKILKIKSDHTLSLKITTHMLNMLFTGERGNNMRMLGNKILIIDYSLLAILLINYKITYYKS